MDEYRSVVPAWGASLILHGVLGGVVFALTMQVKPMVQENLFQWDVALVEATKSESSNHSHSVMTPEQPSAKAMPQPRPKRVAEVSEAIRSREQKIEPPPPAIEQRIDTPQVREEPLEQRLVAVAEPKIEPIVAAKEPEAVEAQPVQHESVVETGASTSSHEAVAPQEASEESPSRATDVDLAPVQVAKAPSSGLEVKTDDRWVGDSLHRRVAEVKRYPNSARMNGQEGKVILKAVIRSDGQLADVFVQKSSGYSALDAAAIEAVKLACPLHMKRAMGKPQIVVSLPIVYSLTN